jgi:hypothetical protein
MWNFPPLEKKYFSGFFSLLPKKERWYLKVCVKKWYEKNGADDRVQNQLTNQLTL